MERTELPIAVFDSGLGGISVLRALVQRLPGEDFLYFGDSANAPYGVRPAEEVRRLTQDVIARLYDRGIKAAVIACNTATSAAIGPLRAAFPEQFIGGIQDSPFAQTQCPDLILSEHSTWKRIYLHRMKHSEICIASTGLHQSSGWKIAEYLAAGRAIVSEPLCYEVPGPFQAGENYLTYTSADGCIEQIRTLLAHPEQILQMGQRNRAYYDTWLRPDQIVAKALEQAKISL